MVREAVINDITDINQLGLMINDDFDKLFDLINIFKDSNSKLFVYELNNIVVGFIHFSVLYDVVDLLNIVVDPIYRKKNIASELMNAMFSYVNLNEYEVILEVAVNNLSAISLYKKYNFEIIRKIANYYNGIDAYIMRKLVNKNG